MITALRAVLLGGKATWMLRTPAKNNVMYPVTQSYVQVVAWWFFFDEDSLANFEQFKFAFCIKTRPITNPMGVAAVAIYAYM